jgi:hypothetical protein
MRLLTAVTLLLLLVPASRAQERGHADPSELKGLKRVYVDAGTSRKNRELIVKELRKSKVGVEVLDAPESAELILLFSTEKIKAAAGVERKTDVLGNPTDKTEVKYVDIEHGYGSAYVPVAGGGRRVLFTWEGRKKFLTGTAEKFADAFVKEYKKANALK